MKGIESAFFGTVGKAPELKKSKAGNSFATISVAVNIGQDEHGKPVTQWVRLACFGEVAERIAATVKKADRIYAEGSLTLNRWTAHGGEERTDLNVAAWKVEKLGAIGRDRPRQDAALSRLRELDQRISTVIPSSY